MSARVWKVPGIAGCLMALACARPDVRLERALQQELVMRRTRTVMASEMCASYESGFRAGAAMIPAARKHKRAPVLPIIRTGEELELDELDGVTGFYVHRLGSDFPEYSRGVMEGFHWALNKDGADLVHPVPAPMLPSPDLFQDFNPEITQLSFRQRKIQVNFIGGVLLWKCRDSGFAPLRGWMDLKQAGIPTAVAVHADCLWLETRAGLLAIDLERCCLRLRYKNWRRPEKTDLSENEPARVP